MVKQPSGLHIQPTPAQTAVKRSYGYDKTGNLIHSSDQRTGTTHFEYDKLGRITQAGNERFAFDPAHNILSTNGQTVSDGLNAVTDNRLKHYNGISYYYDDLGNLIHRELPNGEVQNYFYDLHDQLIKVAIQRNEKNYQINGNLIHKNSQQADLNIVMANILFMVMELIPPHEQNFLDLMPHKGLLLELLDQMDL